MRCLRIVAHIRPEGCPQQKPIDSFVLRLFSGFEVAPPPQLQPDSVPEGQRPGESVTEALLRVRDEIRSTQAELMMVRAAPLPADEIKAQLAAEVERLAREARPSIRVEGGKVALHWPDVQLYAGPNQAFTAPSGSASKLLCALFPDQLEKLLTAGVADVPGAISSADRPGRMRDLEARIYGLEIAEERLVMMALDAGLEVQRRPEASPWAVLTTTEDQALAEAAE